VKRKVKFWLFFLLGISIFVPFFVFSLMARMFSYAIWLSVLFLVYCYFLHHFVYKGEKAKYPMMPPEGRMDAYFPRTNIPRPIYEDMQRYPQFFKQRKRKDERIRRVKKKS